MAIFGSGMQLLAATPVAGFNLVNSTPNIFTYTMPNDGNLHRIFLISIKHITSNETGGAVAVTMTLPDGTSATPQIFSGGANSGVVQGNYCARTVETGTTVTLAQSSNLSVGATVLWAELWGS